MSQQSMPVEPLDYVPLSHNSWLPILKAAALAAMALGTSYFLNMLCQSAMFVLGNIRFTTFANFFGIVLEVTKGLAGVAMIIFGFQCLRIAPISRRPLISAIGAAAIFSVISGVWACIFIFNAVGRSTISGIQLSIQFAIMLTSTATNLILPALLLWVLTRSEVKDIFREGQFRTQ